MYSIVGLVSEKERIANGSTFFGKIINVHSCGKYESDAAESFERKANWRDEMLMYLLGGEVSVSINGKTHMVSVGDVAILPARTAYKVYYSENARWRFAHYDKSISGEVFGIPDDTVFHIGESEELLVAFDRLRISLQRRDYNSAIISTANCIELFSIIGRLYNRKENDVRFEDPIEYVANVMAGSKLGVATVGDYAELAGCSASEFRKRFKDKYGISPKQYILDLRMAFIKDALADQALTLKEAAKASCFSDYAYFSRFVLKHLGMSPQKYREKILAEIYKFNEKEQQQ